MSAGKTCLLIAIWAICSASGIAAGVMLMRVSAHPLATEDMWSTWLLFDLPYVLLAVAGLLSYSRAWLLISLLIASGLVAGMITPSCYIHMEQSLFVLDSRAAGRHGMICGPPLSLLMLPVAYLMSSVAVVVSLEVFYIWLVRKVSYTPRAQK